MQTIYFQTSNFIRHTGNLVDLTEYRRKLALAQETRETAVKEIAPEEETEYIPLPRKSAQRRRARARLTGILLDWAASAALIVVAVVFTLKIL